MASPQRLSQRFSEATNPGDEPLLVDEGFEIVEDDAVDVANAEIPDDNESGGGGLVAWILFGTLVTACTASLLLIGLPMYDELQALRADKHRLTEELQTANQQVVDLGGQIEQLDATRARLTGTVAQKTVALDDSLRANADLQRQLRAEIKKNEARDGEGSAQVVHRGRRSGSRRR